MAPACLAGAILYYNMKFSDNAYGAEVYFNNKIGKIMCQKNTEDTTKADNTLRLEVVLFLYEVTNNLNNVIRIFSASLAWFVQWSAYHVIWSFWFPLAPAFEAAFVDWLQSGS